jgi:hypothetical protein
LIPFVETVIPHSERWEYIDFVLPVEALRSIGSDFPLLRSLTVGPSEHTEDPADSMSLFGNTLNLKVVTLIYSFVVSVIELGFLAFFDAKKRQNTCQIQKLGPKTQKPLNP